MRVNANPRLDLFLTTTFNRGTAAVSGLDYRTSELYAGPIAGLDFDLMNREFPEFSDLYIRQVVHSAGFNYRLSDDLQLNGAIEYRDYKDKDPWLYNTSGRRVFSYAGFSWLF